ncbi:MAG: NAD(P)-dependent oxidoreductase, partial [Balneolales bacterium]
PETGPEENQLRQADALLVRTVTQVDEQMLDLATKLKFIGTASAGTDHIDLDTLEARGVQFASSPGNNARSVAEYVATSILLWCGERKIAPESLTAGIVGVGNAGGQVRKVLNHLGLQTRNYDPPRQRREPKFKSDTLADILLCDVVTLHVPLSNDGTDATYNWLDEQKIKTSAAQLFINAARGGIADESALLAEKQERGSDYILDVWSDEPVFDDKIAATAFIATPHIAGYSRQSKRKAIQIVCDALNTHFNLEMPVGTQEQESKKTIAIYQPDSLDTILTHIHPIRHYDEQLRLLMGLHQEEKALKFAGLRNEIALREEFENIVINGDIIKEHPVLKKLGVDALP